MQAETEVQFELGHEFKENLHTSSLARFLSYYNIQFTVIKDEMTEKLEKAVRNGEIPKSDLNKFLDIETRYGHNRSIYCYDIAADDIPSIKQLDQEKLERLLETKGWSLPTVNLIDFYHPEALTLAEYNINDNCNIDLTFVETIKTTKSKENIVKRENNYYFVNINPNNSTFSVRLRPRSNAVKVNNGYISESIKNVDLFYKITSEVKKIFGFSLVNSNHFKNVLYKIATDMTEKAEAKWKKEVNKYEDEINLFAESMESKLSDINTEQFDLKFRLKRLLERALIKSNFKELKTKGPEKKGYVDTFHFSDKSGGKIKASSKEKERAIELSEIYYDTRDTIDKVQSYDALWVHWFKNKQILRTKLEATSEFYQIHFFRYIGEEDLNHVLSEVREYRNT